MRKNVGRVDAHIRITAGFILLGIGIVKKSLMTIAIGSCKVSEGITQFCPILYILGLSTSNNDKKFWFS